ATLLALLRDPGDGKDRARLVLRADRTRPTYDVRRGERVPRPHRLRITLERGAAALFASLPYEVTGLALVVPPEVHAGRRLEIGYVLRTDNDSPGKHLLHVELHQPDGDPIPYYAKNVVCEGGVGKSYIPLSLSEHPGSYVVHVRDVLSGVSTQERVKILPPAQDPERVSRQPSVVSSQS
ncbi:MAG TPA: hypothetical protein HPP83_02975, partial [Candidatus Hydrogenedentes bacterium]|nr:hypothetical protein [Candidatus Hydrogenedentota bacterium]